MFTTAEELERLVSECKTASTWFHDYRELDAIYEAHRPHPVLKLPRPSNYEMGVLILDGEALVRKLRERETARAKS